MGDGLEGPAEQILAKDSLIYLGKKTHSECEIRFEEKQDAKQKGILETQSRAWWGPEGRQRTVERAQLGFPGSLGEQKRPRILNTMTVRLN